MSLLAESFETIVQGIAVCGLAILLFLTGLVWSAAVQLVRIARSLQRIADCLEKKD